MTMARKNVNVVRSASPDTLAMLLRSGSGKHGDRRTKRQRDRGAAKRAAIRDAA
jgi:hypothetical protein